MRLESNPYMELPDAGQAATTTPAAVDNPYLALPDAKPSAPTYQPSTGGVWESIVGQIRSAAKSCPPGQDCSQFTQTITKQMGANLPRTAVQQFKATKRVDAKDLAPGDLVFFDNGLRDSYNTQGKAVKGGYVNHVGIYLGNGKFTHDPGKSSDNRRELDLNDYLARTGAKFMGGGRSAAIERKAQAKVTPQMAQALKAAGLPVPGLPQAMPEAQVRQTLGIPQTGADVLAQFNSPQARAQAASKAIQEAKKPRPLASGSFQVPGIGKIEWEQKGPGFVANVPSLGEFKGASPQVLAQKIKQGFEDAKARIDTRAMSPATAAYEETNDSAKPPNVKKFDAKTGYENAFGALARPLQLLSPSTMHTKQGQEIAEATLDTLGVPQDMNQMGVATVAAALGPVIGKAGEVAFKGGAKLLGSVGRILKGNAKEGFEGFEAAIAKLGTESNEASALRSLKKEFPEMEVRANPQGEPVFTIKGESGEPTTLGLEDIFVHQNWRVRTEGLAADVGRLMAEQKGAGRKYGPISRRLEKSLETGVPDEMVVAELRDIYRAQNPIDAVAEKIDVSTAKLADDVPIAPAKTVVPEQTVQTPPTTKKPPVKIEAEKPPVAGAYNAHTQAARTARGAPDVDKGGYVLPKDAYEAGKTAVESKKIDPRILARDVSGKPRQLLPEETGALTYDQARISNEMDEVSKLLDSETDSAKLAGLYERQQNLDLALDMNEQALQKAGTRQSEAFRARQMAADQNFSFVGMRRRFKGAVARELNEAEIAQAKTLSGKVSELEKNLQLAVERLERMEAEKSVRRAAGQVKEALKGTLNAKYTNDDLGAALKSLHGSLNTGVTFDQMKAMKIIAGHYLERGAKTAEEIFKVIKEQVGDQVDNVHIWSAIRQATGETGRNVNRGKSLGEDIMVRGDYGYQSKEVQALREALEMAKYDAQRYEANLRARAQYDALATWQKVSKQIVDLTMLAPRGLKATLDFSAPFRQGIFFAMAHPIVTGKNFPAMFRSWTTEEGFRSVQGRIRAHPRYREALKSGIYFSDIDSPLSIGMKEEQFASSLLENVPLVRNSNRAYSAFLDQMRMDLFDLYATQLESAGVKLTDEIRGDIGRFINVASGRGHGTGVTATAKLMGHVGFAPRYAASRIQLAAGVPIWMAKSPQGQKLVAQQYAKVIALAATTVGVLRASGVNVEVDPRSTQFLKAKVGNGYVDIFGSMQQPIRNVAQLLGGFKNEKGKIDDPNWSRSIGNFINYKLTPTLGVFRDWAEGKKISGETPDLANQLRDWLVPLSIIEGIENVREYGAAGGSAATVGTVFGMSTNIISPDADPIGRPYSRLTRDDPYMRELARIGYKYEIPDRRKEDGESRKDRDARAQAMGDFVMKNIRPFMDSAQYKALPPLLKKEQVEKMATHFRKQFNHSYSQNKAIEESEARTKELQRQEAAGAR